MHTTAVKPLLKLSRRRVLVKTVRLNGDVSQRQMPRGFTRLDAGMVTKKWGVPRLRRLPLGLAVATATKRA